MKIERTKRAFRMSEAPKLSRPHNLEEVAFWPATHLAVLIHTKQVSSEELTQMYLGRLKRYNRNCFVRSRLPKSLPCNRRARRIARLLRATTADRCMGFRTG